MLLKKLGEAIENSEAMAKTIEDTMGKILENVGIGIDFDDFDITGVDWSKGSRCSWSNYVFT